MLKASVKIVFSQKKLQDILINSLKSKGIAVFERVPIATLTRLKSYLGLKSFLNIFNLKEDEDLFQVLHQEDEYGYKYISQIILTKYNEVTDEKRTKLILEVFTPKPVVIYSTIVIKKVSSRIINKDRSEKLEEIVKECIRKDEENERIITLQDFYNLVLKEENYYESNIYKDLLKDIVFDLIKLFLSDYLHLDQDIFETLKKDTLRRIEVKRSVVKLAFQKASFMLNS